MVHLQKISIFFKICFFFLTLIIAYTTTSAQEICNKLTATVNTDSQTIVQGFSNSKIVTIQDASGNKHTAEVNDNGSFSIELNVNLGDWLLVTISDGRHTYQCEVKVSGIRDRSRNNRGRNIAPPTNDLTPSTPPTDASVFPIPDNPPPPENCACIPPVVKINGEIVRNGDELELNEVAEIMIVAQGKCEGECPVNETNIRAKREDIREEAVRGEGDGRLKLSLVAGGAYRVIASQKCGLFYSCDVRFKIKN